MPDQTNNQDSLIDLLREAIKFYGTMNHVIDTCNPEMPVTSEDSGDLLFAYLHLYGKVEDNKHGGYCRADAYKSFMDRAQILKGLPEIDSLVERIEKARANLEKTVRALKPQDVLELGYELRQDGERLLVYIKK